MNCLSEKEKVAEIKKDLHKRKSRAFRTHNSDFFYSSFSPANFYKTLGEFYV